MGESGLRQCVARTEEKELFEADMPGHGHERDSQIFFYERSSYESSILPWMSSQSQSSGTFDLLRSKIAARIGASHRVFAPSSTHFFKNAVVRGGVEEAAGDLDLIRLHARRGISQTTYLLEPQPNRHSRIPLWRSLKQILHAKLACAGDKLI